MPLILPGNVASATAGGYEVANSCRFNDGDSSYLSQSTSSSTGKIFTFSFWMKKSTDGSNNGIFVMSSDSLTHNYIEVATKSAAGLDVQLKNGSGGTFLRRKTTRVLRDVSAWYHVCIRFDSTAAEANRLRIYVNGTQETAIDVDGTPAVPEDYVTDFNNSSTINIARNIAGSHYYDGYLAEMVLVDGSSLAPTSFGEFDEDSPTIFKPKDVSGLTFGTNGFYLDFEDSGDLGDDESGEGNDFTETNLAAADQATDTPTNNFCTMNPLIPGVSNTTYSEGNNLVTQTTAAWRNSFATIGVSAGKWYWEGKWITGDSGVGSWNVFGIDNSMLADPYTADGSNTTGIGYKKNGDLTVAGSAQTDIATYATGDIISMALDMDNYALYFRKNNDAWENSGDPTSGATKTGAYTPPIANSTYFATVSPYDTASSGMNFGGSSPFAISSANADANGYGAFEYAVPSGYYAICTKNLAEFGG